MKNLLFAMVALISIATFSCKKIDKLTQFEMDFTESVTIPSTVGINLPFNIPTPEITTNIEEEMEVNNTKKDLIEEAKAIEVTLKITAPEGQTFNPLNSIEVYINADGLTKKRVAFKTTIPDDVTSIDMDLEDVDLSEYIKKEKFNLDIKVKTDQILGHNVDVEVYANFHVDAKILGI